MANGSDNWFQRTHPDALEGPIAYFCAEYGVLRVARDLLRRPRRARRRPHEDDVRHGPAVRRRRAALPQRLLPPDDRRRRPPGARLPRLRPDAAAGQPGPGARRRTAPGPRRAAGPRPPGRGLGAPRSAGRRSCCLDTDIPENGDADRPITHILYVRGREMRLHQELVLGVGGVRALRALGHRAVGLAPQRGPLGVPARRARPRVRRRGRRRSRRPGTKVRGDSVFTIHTPVSAGNERFAADLVRAVAGPLLDGDGRPATGGVPVDQVLELGRRRRGRREPSST